MTIWMFYLAVAVILSAGGGFIWLILSMQGSGRQFNSRLDKSLNDITERDISHIFNDEFREELRNRGLLHFEKIINENAEFLQQDLRLTSSQLNEFMKSELTTKVRDELAKYEQSINDARDLAVDSIKKTSEALEEQRKVLSDQVEREIAAEKARVIEVFERQLTDIVSHYIVAAIGNEINLDDQLEYILADFEANKKAMIEDIKNG